MTCANVVDGALLILVVSDLGILVAVVISMATVVDLAVTVTGRPRRQEDTDF